MPPIELRRLGSIAYREARPESQTGAPVLCVHGYPESSRMWTTVMEALAAGGRHAIAPDLYGLGDSPSEGPQTFETNLDALTRFVAELGLERVVVCVHDWGGLVGLAWACDHPEAVEALVISDTGFFADGRWHGMAEAVRSKQGEQLVGAIDRDGFAGLLRSQAGDAFSEADIEAYWQPFADGRGQRTTLEFYRSMDFAKLGPWQGKLGELGVPTLLLWGADDQFASVASAHRFEREIRGAKLVVIEGAGHFVIEERPERCAEEIASFLIA
jgi:haloalkane dehalogenase